MPTIRKVKTKTQGTKWRAEVWINGIRESKRFDTKPQAVQWSYQREAELAQDGRLIAGQTVGAALRKYELEEAHKKRGARSEITRLRRLQRDPIANELVELVTLKTADEYRDRRLAEVQSPSVIREMTVIASVLRQCVKWNWIKVYPWDGFEWPKKNKARDKVYSVPEIELIMEAAEVTQDSIIVTRAQQVAMAFLFATETAARQSEICNLEWSDFSASGKKAILRETKNGESRDIALSTRAREVVDRMPKHHIRPWPMTGELMSSNFRKLRKKAGIHDGTFHDSRRTACVKLSKKLNPMDLAKLTGHKDLKMLLEVYYRADAEDLADLLD